MEANDGLLISDRMTYAIGGSENPTIKNQGDQCTAIAVYGHTTSKMDAEDKYRSSPPLISSSSDWWTDLGCTSGKKRLIRCNFELVVYVALYMHPLFMQRMIMSAGHGKGNSRFQLENCSCLEYYQDHKVQDVDLSLWHAKRGDQIVLDDSLFVNSYLTHLKLSCDFVNPWSLQMEKP
nr:hypothetical protein [Tanacetum cinerariifolium]